MKNPGLILALSTLVFVLLAGACLYDPHLDVPVLSPLACSLKGDTWYGGGLLGPAGCYLP